MMKQYMNKLCCIILAASLLMPSGLASPVCGAAIPEMNLAATENSITASCSTDIEGRTYRFQTNGETSPWSSEKEGVGIVSSTVFNATYDISGNGGRKLVKLSNGWLVAAALDAPGYIRFYVSKDNGITWDYLCKAGNWSSIQSFALSSKGTMVYSVVCGNNVTVRSDAFDATTVAVDSTFGGPGVVDNSQLAIKACSLAIDKEGTLHAAWTSRNSTYPNSFNIRYSKSVDGGHTWSAAVQVTKSYASTDSYYTLCINVMGNGEPHVISRFMSYTTHYIETFYCNGSTWNESRIIADTYQREAPCTTVDSTGVIHAVWSSADSTDPSNLNIMYAKSVNNGVSWTTPEKLTHGNTYSQTNPTIACDINNNIYVAWEGKSSDSGTNNQIRRVKSKGGIWGQIQNITTGTSNKQYASLCDNLRDFTEPLMLYKDYQSPDSVKIWGLSSESTPYTFSKLTPGKEYPVIMEVKDTQGQISTYTKKISTIPEVPLVSSITNTNNDVLLVFGDGNDISTEYYSTITFAGNDGIRTETRDWGPVENKSILIAGVRDKESVTITVVARNADGTESIPLHLENLQELAGIMSEVKGLRGKAGTDSIRLEWLPVKGAQGYEIEMDGAVLTPNPPITEAFHLFTALEPDKSHSFRIRPVKGGISGPWSGLLTVRTTKPVPGEVGAVNAVKGNHWIALSWTAATNAWSYEVELDGELRAAGSSLSLKAEALPQNSVHTVRVRGMNRDGAGPWSPLQYIWTENRVPGSVENLRSVADNKVLSLLWTPHEDAEGYDVKITAFKDDQVQSTEVIETREAYADYFGAKTGYTYTCSVSAKNIAGNGPWTSVSDIALYAISTPVIQWVDAENEDLIIQWELVTDAFKYEIQQDGVIIGEAVRNWYKIPFSDAETHVYRVRGKTVEGGYSNWSEAVESKPVPKRPDWVKELSGFVGADSITLNWTPVAPKTAAAEDAIRGYDVEVDGYIIQTTDTTYRHDNLQPYTDHRYRVRAVTANRDGFWTDFYRIKTPAALLARIYEIRVKSNRHTNIMSWDPVEGAQWYEVEADGKVIKGYSAEWFEQHGVTEFQEHTYRVRACNRYVKGPWSRFVINNAIQAQVKKGEELELGLTATDMTQFSKYRLEVYYPSVLRVEDLCAYTGTKELSSGMIAGTDIEIVNHSPGRVEFIVHKNIDEGTSWTGIINNIVFKGVETGGTTLTYTVHDIEGENEPEKPHDLSIQEKINFEKANPYAPVQ